MGYYMKKVLFILLLFNVLSVRAQLMDTFGALSVQGAMTNGSVSAVGQGLSMVNKNRLLSDMQQAIIEIQTQNLGNYAGVSSASVSPGLFSGVAWQIGSAENSSFYIELNQLDNQTCQFLLTGRLPAFLTEVNGQKNSKNCADYNRLKFFFH